MANHREVRTEVLGLDFVLRRKDGRKELLATLYDRVIVTISLSDEQFGILEVEMAMKNAPGFNWFDRLTALVKSSSVKSKKPRIVSISGRKKCATTSSS